MIIWRAPSLGTPRDVKEGFGKDISLAVSMREPGGVSYTQEFERQVKEGSGNRASLSLYLSMCCEGNLEGGFLYWGP